MSGGGSSSVMAARDCEVIERSTLASCVGCGGTAVRGARGLALAEAEAGAAVREAQPMSGVATRPSAARPIPWCRKFLRDAIVIPI